MKQQHVLLSAITIRGSTQARVTLDIAAIANYAEAYRAGRELPPVDLFWDGKTYWIGDGFHRVMGCNEAGKLEVPASVHDGTERDAKLFACGANATHGVPRTTADKEKAVAMLLQDDEWGQRSTAWIAEQCKVSDHFVEKVRKKLGLQKPSQVMDRRGHSRKASVPHPAKTASPAREMPSQPEHASPEFPKLPDGAAAARAEGETLLRDIASIQKRIAAYTAGHYGSRHMRQQSFTDCVNLRNAVSFSLPFSGCPSCFGKRQSCEWCHGENWVNEAAAKQIPKQAPKKAA